MLGSDKKQCLATTEDPLSLLCVGDDPLRVLLTLDCIGRQELSTLRLCCKLLLGIGALVVDTVRSVYLAFDGTTVFGPRSNSTSIDLRQRDPNNPKVKRILNSAFDHSRFTSVLLPDSLTHIGDDAFHMSNLRSLDLSASLVTHIGDYAFRLSNLTTLKLPASLTHIGESAFYESRLTTLVLPDSLTHIGDDAFYGSKLITLKLPASLTHIGESAFRLSNLTALVLPDSLTHIGRLAFFWSMLTTLVLSDSLTHIGDYAFQASKLTTLILPASLTHIGKGAFCDSLKYTGRGAFHPHLIVTQL